MSDESPENCMQISDLDGFLTAIVVGPDLIKPSRAPSPFVEIMADENALHAAGSIFPKDYSLLAELSKLRPKDMREALDKNMIYPDMGRTEVRVVIDSYKPEGAARKSGRPRMSEPGSPGSSWMTNRACPIKLDRASPSTVTTGRPASRSTGAGESPPTADNCSNRPVRLPRSLRRRKHRPATGCWSARRRGRIAASRRVRRADPGETFEDGVGYRLWASQSARSRTPNLKKMMMAGFIGRPSPSM